MQAIALNDRLSKAPLDVADIQRYKEEAESPMKKAVELNRKKVERNALRKRLGAPVKVYDPESSNKKKPIMKVIKNRLRNGSVGQKRYGKTVLVIPKEKKQSIIKKGGNVKRILRRVTDRAPSSLAVQKDFAIMKPLSPVMYTALKYVGVKPSGNVVVLTEQFYNNVVARKSQGIIRQPNTPNFEGNFHEINLAHTTFDNVDSAKDAIISGVLSFVKSSKLKKQTGEPMTKLEEIVADGTETVETNLKKTAKEQAAKTIGEKLLFDRRTQLIVGGVVLFIIIVVYLIARKS